MRDHKKLRAFELADGLALSIYQSTQNFPASERYGLQSQLRRAAVSVPANLVEGCARTGPKEYARFVEIAYASCREVEYLVSLAARLDFFSSHHAEPLDATSQETSRVLHGLLRSLRRL